MFERPLKYFILFLFATWMTAFWAHAGQTECDVEFENIQRRVFEHGLYLGHLWNSELPEASKNWDKELAVLYAYRKYKTCSVDDVEMDKLVEGLRKGIHDYFMDIVECVTFEGMGQDSWLDHTRLAKRCPDTSLEIVENLRVPFLKQFLARREVFQSKNCNSERQVDKNCNIKTLNKYYCENNLSLLDCTVTLVEGGIEVKAMRPVFYRRGISHEVKRCQYRDKDFALIPVAEMETEWFWADRNEHTSASRLCGIPLKINVNHQVTLPKLNVVYPDEPAATVVSQKTKSNSKVTESPKGNGRQNGIAKSSKGATPPNTDETSNNEIRLPRDPSRLMDPTLIGPNSTGLIMIDNSGSQNMTRVKGGKCRAYVQSEIKYFAERLPEGVKINIAFAADSGADYFAFADYRPVRDVARDPGFQRFFPQDSNTAPKKYATKLEDGWPISGDESSVTILKNIEKAGGEPDWIIWFTDADYSRYLEEAAALAKLNSFVQLKPIIKQNDKKSADIVYKYVKKVLKSHGVQLAPEYAVNNSPAADTSPYRK